MHSDGIIERMALLQRCAHPDCAEVQAEAYCPRHEAERKAKLNERRRFRRRADRGGRGYDRSCEKARTEKLRRDPVCEAEGCDRTATHVHHRDGQGPSGPGGNSWANLESLCPSCHNALSARQRHARVG